MTELRDYQQEMLGRVHRAWRKHQSVMVQMPTGTGKTHLMAAVIREQLSKGVLVVAHRVELIQQIKETLLAFGIEAIMNNEERRENNEQRTIYNEERTKNNEELGITCWSNEPRSSSAHEMTDQIVNRESDGFVIVESIQKLSRHLAEVAYEPGLIVVDEAHHALASTYRILWDRWPKAKFLGLTATPCRLNGAPFTDLFDVLLQSWDIRKFIRKGWLSDFEYVSASPDNLMARQVFSLRKRGTDGDYQTKEMAAVMDCPESIEHLYKTYRTFALGRKGIVYAINREHAMHIQEYYAVHGVDCAMIDAKTPAQERERLVDDYKLGVLRVLVNVDIFSEGFDCPEVEFIQLARPTLSLSKYLQQVGRGMRVSDNKSHVLILDQVGLYQTFGLPTDDRDWQSLFLGQSEGKGNVGVSRCVLKEADVEEKELVNLEMVRIKSCGEMGTGLEVFLQGGRYGVMRNGMVTCPAVFREVRRLDRTSRFFALGIYPSKREDYGMTTVIDRKGLDLKVRLYGQVVQDGDFFRVSDGVYVGSWDSVGGRYYDIGFPKVETVGGIEVVFADEKGYKLRCSTGVVSPSFDKDEVLYNHDIAIIRDSLIVKRDNNHAYRIWGYLGDSVLVQGDKVYGYQQIFRDGKLGAFFVRPPEGMTRVVDFKQLGLKRAK